MELKYATWLLFISGYFIILYNMYFVLYCLNESKVKERK